MNLRLLDELQPMLDGAKEPIRQGEGGRIAAVHVPGLGQLAESLQRGRLPDQRVGRSVHELQELHGEFDVAYAAAAALDLTLGEALARDDLLGAALHRPQLGEIVGVEAVTPDGARSGRGECRAELGVTGAARAFRRAWNSQGRAQRSQ